MKLTLVILATAIFNSPVPPDCSTVTTSTATVSWYNLPGRPMANGQTFDGTNPHLAAHKDLPFGTLVKLTNPNNCKTLTVTITDRGPFIEGRDFDVSKAAAEFLGFIADGVIQLQYEVLN